MGDMFWASTFGEAKLLSHELNDNHIRGLISDVHLICSAHECSRKPAFGVESSKVVETGRFFSQWKLKKVDACICIYIYIQHIYIYICVCVQVHQDFVSNFGLFGLFREPKRWVFFLHRFHRNFQLWGAFLGGSFVPTPHGQILRVQSG